MARALYLRLRKDASLWLRGEEFVTADRPALEAALDASGFGPAGSRSTKCVFQARAC